MEFIGKPTIHPFLFYSGKISAIVLWIMFFIHVLGVHIFHPVSNVYVEYTAYFVFLMGLSGVFLSWVSLGISTRIGIPVEETMLKTRGIYRLSRNPMYVSFHFMTIATSIFFHNVLIISLGFYSVIIYHMIILEEEKFLTRRFGDDYLKYKKGTRRYL